VNTMVDRRDVGRRNDDLFETIIVVVVSTIEIIVWQDCTVFACCKSDKSYKRNAFIVYPDIETGKSSALLA